MIRSEIRQAGNVKRIRQFEDEIVDDNAEEIAMRKASAAYYDRSWKRRLKEQRGNWWIVLGLYLILFSVAFVIF